jgi:carbamoyltransferase
MKIISLHNGHDASITAMQDGHILYHWELERHYEKRYIVGIYHGNLVAETLMGYCLPKLGWTLKDVDAICFAGLYNDEQWSHTEFASIIKDQSYNALERPCVEWKAQWRGKEMQFFASLHHLNHMAYSYYTSPFDKALLFAYDGMGDFNITTMYGTAAGSSIECKHNFLVDEPPVLCNRIGLAFGALQKVFPFFTGIELGVPGKAMGLSSYGKPNDEWRAPIREFISGYGRHMSEIQKIAKQLGLSGHGPESHIAQDFLATLQSESERYVVNLLTHLRDKHGIRKLCLSGGCALNVLINSKVAPLFDQVYIPPACSDTGQSLGSALYYWHHVLKNHFSGMVWHNPYLGDGLIDLELISNYKTRYKNLTHKRFDSGLLDRVATFLAEGKIVAWAHGRCEIGPRALGNRSILCSPANPRMKDTLNQKVKHREWWRPFAPVCLAEDYKNWFDIDHEQPYMLEAPQVKKPELVGAITHVDGTARLQTVRKSQNPLLHELISKFKNRTGIPMLLNTSLNGQGKPIANTVRAILDLLESSDLDYAVIDNYLFYKLKM